MSTNKELEGKLRERRNAEPENCVYHSIPKLTVPLSALSAMSPRSPRAIAGNPLSARGLRSSSPNSSAQKQHVVAKVTTLWLWVQGAIREWSSRSIAMAVTGASVLVLLLTCGLSADGVHLLQSATSRKPSALPNLDKIYEQKLKNIAAGVSSLDTLGKIVAQVEDTYEDVYHHHLVKSATLAEEVHEIDWNKFVEEARSTGPVFLAGKEHLSEAVANLQRLIRRAPQYLRGMVTWLSKYNAEEAKWYMAKVVNLVDAVHTSINKAAERFATAETVVGGMSRDAKENADHFGNKVSTLEGEVKAIEAGSHASTGRWARSTNLALYGCQLGTDRASLDECRSKCLAHGSGSCNQITYYPTASRRNCYLHCESATMSSYKEADTYVLERAPAEVVQDVTLKTQAAVTAAELQARWHSVQSPLREVSNVVHRFRGATADLRGSLEEARFATDDLQASFKSSASALHPDAAVSGQLRLLERRVEEVISAIEDLGQSLSAIRFQ